MRTSVSTRTSAVATVPLASRRHLELRHRSKCLVEHHGEVHWLVRHVRVDGLAHDCGECLALAVRSRVESAPLLLCEINLRTLRRHTSRIYSVTLETRC